MFARSTQPGFVYTRASMPAPVRTALKSAAILCITLLAAEISLRIYDHFNPLFIFYDQSYTRFRGKPGANDWGFPLNSGGFKDTEFEEKQEGTFRVIGLGDSFAFSIVPYEYSFLTRLELYLQETGDIEVLNLGIPGTGPQEYLNILVHEGLPLAPDLVLVSFFIGNDLLESRIVDTPRAWYTYSHLASVMYFLFQVRAQQAEGFVPPGEGEFCDSCPTYPLEVYLDIEFKRSGIYQRDRTSLLAELVSFAVTHLGEMDRILSARGVEMVVVLIPDELQVNADLQAQVLEVYYPNEDSSIWDMAAPNERLAAALEEIGVPVIDLYPVFIDAGEAEILYRPLDSHLNIAGNELVAEILSGELQRFLTRK
ncbi:MAG TPA: SGNH/GDSL hydrolase family protein [Anaerolineales bacterium]|nr:SGNH/GDSL hydrolase family protein [Anaerolineales bacterium]